jgi:hypothetical protein
MRTISLSLALLSLAAAGCGKSPVVYTVAGKTLTVAEVTIGRSGQGTPNLMTYCQPLATSQYEVVISDNPVCQPVMRKTANGTVFHAGDQANMRLIFPTSLMFNGNGSFKTNTFTVGSSKDCTQQLSGSATAAAIFAHNATANMKYDTVVDADSGTISVTGYNGTGGAMGMPGTSLQGNFDLMFGADHITGTFDGTVCNQLDNSYGQ